MHFLLDKFLILILFVCLYDLYFSPFGRIFDYIAFLILFIFIVKKELIINYKILYIFIVPFSFGVLFFNDIKSVIGILFGVFFGYIFYIYYQKNQSIIPFVWISIFMSIMFLIQLLSFKVLNFYIDFTTILGSLSSRNYIEEIDFFRASGLFQEPNSYCVFAFMMSTILLYSKEDQKYKNIAVLLLISTMIMSNSLWRMILAIGLMFLYFLRKEYKYILTMILILIVTQNIWLEDRTKYRITNIFIESTVQERYIGSKFTEIDSTEINNLILKEKNSTFLKIKNFILGYGSSSYGFQVKYGANGISYLIFNFGLFGLLLFLYYVYYLDDTKYKQKLIITLFLLTSYPYFTYAIFWVWFIVMNFDSINKFKKRIVNC